MRDPRLIEFARRMRREMTAPEKRLWFRLRAQRLCGAKFRRQQVIGPYVADFACRSPTMMVVEVDGETHAESGEWDAVRSAFFEGRGYRVLRFANTEVMRNLEGVLTVIAAALEGDSPSPRPSPLKGRGGLAASEDCR